MVKKYKFVRFFIIKNKFINLRNLTKIKDPDKFQIEPWIALIKIYADLQKFLKDINEIFSNNISIKIKNFYLDINQFQECINIFSEELKSNQKNICKTIVDLFTEKIVTVNFSILIFYFQILGAVSEIPRHYRWTKKPSPSSFSHYLVTFFSLCEELENEMKKNEWKNEEILDLLKNIIENASKVFCEKAEQVYFLIILNKA